MLNQARSIITNIKERPHIFNLGHGVLPETPPENVEVLAKYLRNLGEVNLLNGELYFNKSITPNKCHSLDGRTFIFTSTIRISRGKSRRAHIKYNV